MTAALNHVDPTPDRTPPLPSSDIADHDTLLKRYSSWLFNERRRLIHEMYPEPATARAMEDFVWQDRFVNATVWRDHATPSSRAAAMLSAAGVPLLPDDRSEAWDAARHGLPQSMGIEPYVATGPDEKLLAWAAFFEAEWQNERRLRDDDTHDEALVDAAVAATATAAEHVLCRTATTLAGVIAKARVFAWAMGEDLASSTFSDPVDERARHHALLDLLSMHDRKRREEAAFNEIFDTMLATEQQTGLIFDPDFARQVFSTRSPTAAALLRKVEELHETLVPQFSDLGPWVAGMMDSILADVQALAQEGR